MKFTRLGQVCKVRKVYSFWSEKENLNEKTNDDHLYAGVCNFLH
jgi:hypothetical protein